MRRTLTALLISLLFVPALPARTTRDWNNVKKLRPGTSVEILRWEGDNLDGEIETVSDAALRLAVVDHSGPRASPSRDIDRAAIRRILRVRRESVPDPHKWMLIGTVAGGAIGVTTGAVSDIKDRDHSAHWLTGGFAGAVLGFSASCAALVVVLTVDTVKHLHSSSTRVVYEDNGNHSPSATPTTNRFQ